MDQLMHANLQIIELLGAVFEEVERQGRDTRGHRCDRPAPLRAWVGRKRPDHEIIAASRANAMS